MLLQATSLSHKPNYSITMPKTIERAKLQHPLRASISTTNHVANVSFGCKTTRMSPPRASTSWNSGDVDTIPPSKYEHRRYWTEYFLNYVPDSAAKQAEKEQQVNELKEEVRRELLETMTHKCLLEQLELIDNIQRLGVGYHFEDEIEEALCQIYDNYNHDHNLDLYYESLRFRLLRQHGFYVSCDVFKKYFLDGDGNFKSSLSADVEGMLSLYEASHIRIEGDDILEKAFTFTTTELELMTSKLVDPIATQVAHALDQPLHKGIGRLESRHYISLYEQNPCHNKVLLKFAKLDFNLLQSLHKKELYDLIRWYHNLDVFTKLPIRDILFENYLVSLATMDERPQYSVGRIIIFKVLVVGNMIDDLFDVCAITDLELLTKAIQRWDKECVKELPNNLTLAYTKLLDVFEEVKQHLEKEGRAHAFQHSLQAFQSMWISHLQSSTWFREEYIPPFDVYMTVTMPTTGFIFLTIAGFLGLGSKIVTQDVFEWALQLPNVIQALCKIYRIEDDIKDDPVENVAGNKPSAVSSYMKQYGIMDKNQAYKELHEMTNNAWKDINQAMLRPNIMPRHVLERTLAQARYLYVVYKNDDVFTGSDIKLSMEKILALLFRDPISE